MNLETGHDAEGTRILLTSGIEVDSLQILLEEGGDMPGIIRSKGECQKCGEEFKHLPKLGYICPECKTTPKRFFIDLWHQGKRIRLFSDKTGQVLDTYQRAQTLLSHIRYEIQHHTFDPSKYIKSEISGNWVTTLLDKFLAFKLDSIAPSYKKDYERMTKIAQDFFGTKDVREIRKLDVVNFKTHLEKNFTLKPKSIKNVMDLFKTFLRYLKNDLEVIDAVPAFPTIEVQGYSFKWLSPEEQVKLFEYIPDGHKPIIAFLMLQGCRPGEARALRCKDVDLRDMTIAISATFSATVYREKRKGRGAQAAVIPIHPEMLDYLKNRVSNNLPEAYIFTNPNTGRFYTENALRRIWENVRVKADISKSLRLYDATRHSFASQLVNMGSTIYKVSKLLGHTSTKTTEKYAHPNIESLRTDLQKLSLTVTGLSLERKASKKAV
jgi:integrase